MTTTQKEMKIFSKTAALEPNVKECLESQLPHLNPQAHQTVPKETKEKEVEVITGVSWDSGLKKGRLPEIYSNIEIPDLDRGWEFPMNSKKGKRTGKKEETSQVPTKDDSTSYKEKLQSTTTPPMKENMKSLKEKKIIIRATAHPTLDLLKNNPPLVEETIMSITVKARLNSKARDGPKEAMQSLIAERVQKIPKLISMIGTETFQIFFDQKDQKAFENLLIPGKITEIPGKTEDLQQREIRRLAHLYLSGYYKALARATIQHLKAPLIAQILDSAALLVKTRFNDAQTQKQWRYNIVRDKEFFLPPQVEVDTMDQ
mmetsp:Transcript_36376/g.34396  ORF Transcript_36376/g.34396 Transcript_36376/m.34396 type:complete len:316 (-) Transcript_36376:2458-3405(-)